MKIMSWNSRGSAWDGFEAQTLFYVSCFQVDVLCLLDTRTSLNMLNKFRNFPFNDAYVVPSVGQCGGMNLLWNNNHVSIQVITSHDRFIHCKITETNTHKSCMVTFVYAYPKKEKQAALWNDLSLLSPTDNSSWVLMGDFNIIISPEEKLGGIGGVSNFMLNFSTFLNNNGLVSLQATGLPFTWTNKHVDDTVIFERLDRAISNANFLLNYPDSRLENLPIISSDHGPICLTLENPKRKSSKPFRFEAIWLSHHSFKPLVENIWKQKINTNPILNFVTIAGQFASRARIWNKSVFGNIFRRMEELNQESEEIQQQLMANPNSTFLKQKDTQIRAELLEIWKQEEVYWAQKAKANWLNLGDRNTRFFQAQANIRKKINHISKLQDSSGNWSTNEEDMATILV